MGSPKYDLENTRQFHLKLNRKTDADVIEKLEDQPSMQAYIKRLIREDIQRGTGHWIIDGPYISCSSCGRSYNDEIQYFANMCFCPTCGAKMETAQK